MVDVGNSQPPTSQESAYQPTPDGSYNMETDDNIWYLSSDGLIPNEYVQTPHGESDDNMEVTTKTGACGLKSVVRQHFKKIKINREDKARAYDAENATKELANAIIMHEYPLSIVDHRGFKRYSAALQPSFQVPSRNTIKKEIFKVYDFEKSIALKLLNSVKGRVAITSDMWTSSNQKRRYMAVTAHYIDSSWTLRSRFLRFIYVPVPHSSDRLCNAFFKCLMDWNIDTKLSTITVDNCSTNDAMIEKVKDKLRSSTLLRGGSLLHMCCCAHILNLIVKDGLEVVKDEVEKIRDSVVYWTATPKRKEKFEVAAEQLQIPCTRKLVLDCPTRWSLTYKMLEIAISYEDVFSRLKRRDSQYTCLPNNSQWQFAKDVCGKLKLFNTISEMISGTRYPTANMYFPKICEIKLAISQWINSPNELIKKMAEKMFGKFESYWSMIHDIMGVATVLDPRYKMELLEFYYEKLYERDYAGRVKMIRQLCYDLVSDYQLKINKDSGGGSPMLDGSNVGDDTLSEYDMYIMRRKKARTSYVKTELDHYLEEEVLPRTSDFDILLWWKMNGVKYPTLQAIAKDILAIPISTIASESAFNTSDQILSPHRSRLHWTTLEALMCARSWLWSAENTGCLNSKVIHEYATLLREMESEDEGEMLVSGGISYLEDDQ